jgi:dynactin 1
MSADPPLGAIASVPAGRGIVRFCGTTSFSPGKWVGIELPTAVGKNDGTINGVSYFYCKPNHGVFVRPSQVKDLEIPKVRGRFSMRNEAGLTRSEATQSAHAAIPTSWSTQYGSQADVQHRNITPRLASSACIPSLR